MHGVLVWFRSPAVLDEAVSLIEKLSQPFDTLTVVDTRGDRADVARPLLDRIGTSVEYVVAGSNVGPAGGFALGTAPLIDGAYADDDWVVMLDDGETRFFTDDRLDRVRTFAESAAERDPLVGCVGRRGARLSRRMGVFVAIGEDEFDSIELDVDMVANGQLPFYRLSALRQAGTFRPDMFFGFEELELGLRLRAAGRRVVAMPHFAKDSYRSLVTRATDAPRPGSEVKWRRYYGRRNLLVILRVNRFRTALVFQTLLVPIIMFVRLLRWRPKDALADLGITFRATVDAYRLRLGRTVEPDVMAYGPER